LVGRDAQSLSGEVEHGIEAAVAAMRDEWKHATVSAAARRPSAEYSLRPMFP
jgi:hypothetical protein